MSTRININGINELDFTTGVSSASTVDGVTTIGFTPVSISLDMPSEFSVSGSPASGSGTFVVTKANESENTVYAGPVSGSAAPPTFRSLISADIPNNAANTSGTAGGLSANIAQSQVTGLVAALQAVPIIVAFIPLSSGLITSNVSSTVLYTVTVAGIYRFAVSAQTIISGSGTLTLTGPFGQTAPTCNMASGGAQGNSSSSSYASVGQQFKYSVSGTWTGTAQISVTVEFLHS